MKEAIKGLIRAIAIIFVLLVIMNAFKLVAGTINNGSETGEVKFSGEEQNEEVTEKKDYEMKEEYTDIYNMYNFNMIEEYFGEDFIDVYYKRAELSNEYFLYLSVINLTKDRYVLLCNNINTLSEEDVNNEMQKLFGKVDYTPVSYTNKNETFKITYDETNKEYKVENGKCQGIDNTNGYIETKLLGGIETDDTIELVEIAHFISYKEKDGNMVPVNHRDIYESSTEVIDDSKKENVYAKYKLIFRKAEESTYLTGFSSY